MITEGSSHILEGQGLSHTGLSAVEEWLVGDDTVAYAQAVDKFRLRMECDCIQCTCLKDCGIFFDRGLKKASVESYVKVSLTRKCGLQQIHMSRN